MAQVDLRRVRRSVAQEARRQQREERVEEAMHVLQDLIGHLGELSLSRQMLGRIGRALLCEPVELVVPLCPDYGHADGRYTFSGMSGGVSLMLDKYRQLLEYAAARSGARVTLLYADVEIDDHELMASVGVDRAMFSANIAASVAATQAVVPDGWRVTTMSEEVLDIRECTAATMERIASQMRDRITSEVLQNQDICRRIDPRMSVERMRARLIRTAAQYMALGAWAHERGALVLDGTSMVAWYKLTEAPLLHAKVIF